ncbi:SgcJ/EcaC family oxidoreductase [Mycobacterium deserti]|uniref:SgcJ/EcaC family oxidoreductase n=1 Tax=Mycobacterium deserti TaxID=2978347 RepID=A0ABT2M5R5_9MYCO|nr:SgcJ/EcaC family oxidoreductase [Mycobacterium deserti]MCT7657597.1 SgcJ/EcaC family oxidoreductase [Mycobacterium deserti]
MQGTDVVRDVMDQWKAGIDAHDPQTVAAVFAEDAIFQGLRPYSVGRQGVFDYYDSQPRGMTVNYQIMESRRPTTGLVVGYLRADFAFRDRPPLALNVGVVVAQTGGRWRIVHYQASPPASSGRE